MASEIDFLDLYRQLGLIPGCDLAEFKQAYRRLVSALHPDRRAGGYLDARAAERLQRLTAQYDAAMKFQRDYGRLPGATATARFVSPDATARAWRRRPMPVNTPRRSRSKMLILLAVVAIGVLLWNIVQLSPSPSPETAPAQVTADDDSTQPEQTVAPMLTLGMSSESVRAIQGEPEIIRDDRWEYGPSWIRFDHDKVVDWYSSPFNSLKTPDSRPPDARD